MKRADCESHLVDAVLHAIGTNADEWLEVKRATRPELDLIASYHPLVQRVIEHQTKLYIQALLSKAVGQRCKIVNSILHQKELAQRLAGNSELAIVWYKPSCYRVTIASKTIDCLELAKKLALNQIVGTRRCARFTCSKPFWLVRSRPTFSISWTALACSAIILLLAIKLGTR